MSPLSRRLHLLGIAAALAAGLVPAGRAHAPAPNRVIPPATAEQVAAVDAALPQAARVQPAKPRLILVTARTEGYYHDSIPVGLHALKSLGERTGAYRVEIDHEMSAFTAANLRRFDAILFLSTTQLAFADPAARTALLEFVHGGRGLVGIHAASDNFPTWPAGQALIGGVFHSHPWLWDATVAVKLDEPAHPLNAAFGGRGFWIRDEIYQIVGPYGRDRQRVLMSLDMSRPQNERPAEQFVRADRDFPIGWLKHEGKGRVFYSSLGHNADVFQTPEVLQHWLDGIQFALGDLQAPATPSSTLQPPPAPALAPALPQTLLERGAARAVTSAAFTPANLDAIASHTDDRDNAALRRVDAALRDASPEARAAARAALAKLAARRDLTPAARLAVADWLAVAGDAASVPVLTSWAHQPATADAAIRALAHIAGPAADNALIGLLKNAPAAHRVAVVSALGHRRLATAVKPLAGQLKSADVALAAAVIDALSRIATPEALAAIRGYKAPAALAEAQTWAFLHVVRVLGDGGDRAGALRLLDEVVARPALSNAQRVAAHEARLRLDPATALPEVRAVLGTPFVGVRLAQSWLTAALAAPDSTAQVAALARDFPALPPSSQVTLLALAGQSDTDALAPLARAAIPSTDAVVRHAGYAALAACGTIDDSAVLIAALARDDDREAAAEALARFRASGLEPRLRAAVAGATPPAHAALLDILGGRLDREAMPLLLAAAAGSDRAPRAAGYRGLATLARGEDLELILSLRPQLQPADRRLWQEALRASVRGRNDVAPTLALLRKELDAASPVDRPAYLHAIIGFETPESLAVVKELLASEDLERRKEMVRALAIARNETSFDLLIDVAEKDADNTVRTLALRGYLDTLALRRNRWSETIRAYGRAGRAALRQEERDAVIAALASYDGSESERIIDELKALPPLAGT